MNHLSHKDKKFLKNCLKSLKCNCPSIYRKTKQTFLLFKDDIYDFFFALLGLHCEITMHPFIFWTLYFHDDAINEPFRCLVRPMYSYPFRLTPYYYDQSKPMLFYKIVKKILKEELNNIYLILLDNNRKTTITTYYYSSSIADLNVLNLVFQFV